MKLKKNQKNLVNVCLTNNISYLGLFGSYSRGEEKKTSDIDLLVDFKETKSLFELARIKFEFEDIFHKEVDLVIREGLKKELKPYILKDLQTLYEEKK